MKLTLILSILFVASVAHSDETLSEKAAKHTNTTVRAAKKGVNRVKEAVCMEGDLKCGAKKVGNRIEEAKDATVDEAKAIKEKID